MPPLTLFVFPPEMAAFPEYYVPLKEALDKTTSFRLWDRLRYPKFAGDRRTIALFDFGYFVTEEIARAAEALGHEVVRIPGNRNEKCGDLLSRAIETIAMRKPDFFVTVNHIGFDEGGVLADFFKAIEMPSAIWYVDSPNLVVRAYGKNVSPYSSIFLWDESYLEDMKSLGFENVSCLPLAADESVFRPICVSPHGEKENRRNGRVRRKFDGDVSARTSPESARGSYRRRRKHGAAFRMVSERPFRRCCRDPDGPIGTRDVFHFAGGGEIRFRGRRIMAGDPLYRLSCVRALEEFRPCIRGDAGWKGLVGRAFRLGPPLEYHKELPAFYNACTVNFNATNLQMGKAVNQRVFDVPACGAFLLTDHQESVEGLFEVGKEVVTYKDRGEIADLVRFYLRNDAAREAIAGKGRERVLAEHTYKHRIGTILRRLKETYA